MDTLYRTNDGFCGRRQCGSIVLARLARWHWRRLRVHRRLCVRTHGSSVNREPTDVEIADRIEWRDAGARLTIMERRSSTALTGTRRLTYWSKFKVVPIIADAEVAA